MNPSSLSARNEQHLKWYYRWNSHIYDATRWAILWGRDWFSNYLRVELRRGIKKRQTLSIIELGCGTGYHIAALAPEFKECTFYGYDASEHMLNKAFIKVEKLENVHLQQRYFPSTTYAHSSTDCFICSYSISMNENMLECINAIHNSLNPSGALYVVDFISTSSIWFNRWMNVHGVYIRSEIISKLQNTFTKVEYETKRGFMGLYQYGIIKAIK